MADKARERHESQDEISEPAKKVWHAPELKEFGIDMTEGKGYVTTQEFTPSAGPS